SVDLARVYFLIGAACAEDPARLEQGEKAYREGLRLRPGHAGAANQLALLALGRGDLATALADIELALRIDASHGLAWRSAARVGPGGDAGLLERLGELERELTAVYDEWATYLRSMQAAGPRFEIMPVAPLIAEVVAQASATLASPAASAAGAAVAVELKLVG